MSDLSPGWAWVEIDDLLAPLEDGRLLHHGWSPQCHKEPSEGDDVWGVLKTTAIQLGEFLPEHNKRLPDGLSPRPVLEVKAGDLIVTSAGPRARCGVPCLVRITRPRLMLSGKMYRFRVDERLAESRLVEVYLLSATAQRAIDAMKTGISDSGLNLTHARFRKLAVPLPPLNEQRRIVAAIEEHLSRLDAADASLAGAALRSEPLTQVTLGAAFGGDWPVSSLGELVSVIRGVTYKKEQARGEAGEGYLPIVRATNIDGRLTLDNFVYVPAGVVRPEQMLRPGDVVVAASSGSASVVGKSAMLKESWVGSFGAFCAVLRSREGVDPSYVAAFVSSPLVRRRWSSLAAGTNINNLKREHIVKTGIPLPPLSEQQRIVQEVEQRLSGIDALRSAIERAQRRSAALRRAVLERAFRGELVPQDPSDEPAEALLARIRAEPKDMQAVTSRGK